MIKAVLQDVVAHTHALGFLPVVKITSNEDTIIESMADDRSVIVNAKTHEKVKEFNGVFGLPSLEKLNLHLKNPEYKENAVIKVLEAEKNGVVVPTGLHFENATGDFQNDYRFMSTEIINAKLKPVEFKGANWDVEFEPSIPAIQRFKLQSNAHSEENAFQVKTDGDNLVFYFGNASSHAGSFVFQPNIGGKLTSTWSWPVTRVLSILNLNGDITMRISSKGVMKITVDSGITEYNYLLPAMVS